MSDLDIAFKRIEMLELEIEAIWAALAAMTMDSIYVTRQPDTEPATYEDNEGDE